MSKKTETQTPDTQTEDAPSPQSKTRDVTEKLAQDGKPFPTPGKVTQGTGKPTADPELPRKYPEPTD